MIWCAAINKVDKSVVVTVMIEFRRLFVELGTGARSWREGTVGGEIDAVGDVLLEVL